MKLYKLTEIFEVDIFGSEEYRYHLKTRSCLGKCNCFLVMNALPSRLFSKLTSLESKITFSGDMAAPDENFEQYEEEDGADTSMVLSSVGRKRLFSKELRCMMYGFGDDQNPYTESVDIIEDLVIEFITEMTHKYLVKCF